MGELSKNQILYTTDGEKIKINKKIGEGGQGIVYKVFYHNKPHALKWYYKGKETDDFYKNLKHNVEIGTPNEFFLWPLALTERDDNNCFGYIMKLREKEFCEFPNFLTAKVKFSSFSAIVNAALQLTTAFLQLHARGQSYQDLNDGNFFINPNTGDVLVCDNDNVAPDKTNLGIIGKAGYLAPEILNRELDCMPDKYSDRFSLAVVLFLLLCRDHPLKGNNEDPDDPLQENEYEIMCKNPVFIFDEKDDSNRPRACYKNAPMYWKIYPQFVKDAFKKAFSKEVMNCSGEDKESRMTETEWCKVFTWLRRCIIVCSKCEKETFFPMRNLEHKCMCCGEIIHRPTVLVLSDNKIIPLQNGCSVYQCDIEDVDFNSITIEKKIGIVVENKNIKGKFGIKNLSDFAWYRKTPAGSENVCEPGDGLLIAKNNTIKFGTKSEGKIE